MVCVPFVSRGSLAPEATGHRSGVITHPRWLYSSSPITDISDQELKENCIDNDRARRHYSSRPQV